MDLYNQCLRKFGEFPTGQVPFENESGRLKDTCRRIERGISDLDSVVPDWRTTVINEGFHLSDPGKCIVTVATGHMVEGGDYYSPYHKALATLGCTAGWRSDEEWLWAQARGFDCYATDTYIELEAVWCVALGLEVI